jgi:putative transposase
MTVGRTNNDYSRWLNIRFERTGHLWQARFFSCPAAPVSCWDVLAYIELNPVRAGLVARPEDWKWSSARAHLTGQDESGLLDMSEWRKHFTPDTWGKFLQKKQHDEEFIHRVRTATRTGRPLASTEDVQQVEYLLGRQLLPRRRPARIRSLS